MIRMSKGTMAVLLLPLTMTFGCRLTDHTESEENIGPEAIGHSASGYERVDSDDRPAITFAELEHNYGKVVQGTKVEHTFTFRNSGGSPLVLSDVRGSCGCTVGKDWPRHPIKPGEKASILVAFDTNGRSGLEHKTVTVVANTTPPTTVLSLRGEVIGPANVAPIE